MATKDNIRQRRQERIKSLLDHGTQERSTGQPDLMEDEARTLNDPEFLWRSQQHYWDHQYRQEHQEKNWGFWSPGYWRYKWIISCLLFALIWGIHQIEEPWVDRMKEMVQWSLTNDFDFASLETWYRQHFDGFPSFIPAFDLQTPSQKASSGSLQSLYQPVAGSIWIPYAAEHPGIVLLTQQDAVVKNVADGRVLYVGETVQTGLTVIIQHADGLRTILGHLENTPLEPNHWVVGGETIGHVTPHGTDGKLYFGMKKAEQFLNPAEVIRFQ